MMKNSLLLELKKFLAVGMIAVSLDWGIYLALTNFFDLGVALSKSLSYIIGTIFAYVANGRFVFHTNLAPTNFLKHLSLYAFSLLMNTLVFVFWESDLSSDSPKSLGTALLTATFASTVINFVGMRFWVFQNNGNSHARR